MQWRVMLLNKENNVVAEVTSRGALAAIDSGEYSLIQWRGKRYIYSRDHDNGEYLFFCEVGRQYSLTDAALKIKESN